MNFPLNPSSLSQQQKEEAKRLISNIIQLTDTDEKQTVQQLVLLLNQLLRVKTIVPPTSETMIFLHGTKPKLYHATRYSLSSSSHLQMLFSIHGDVELADQRLKEFLDGGSVDS